MLQLKLSLLPDASGPGAAPPLVKPEELVRIFLGSVARGWCEGLFITTGFRGGHPVTDELITT